MSSHPSAAATSFGSRRFHSVAHTLLLKTCKERSGAGSQRCHYGFAGVSVGVSVDYGRDRLRRALGPAGCAICKELAAGSGRKSDVEARCRPLMSVRSLVQLYPGPYSQHRITLRAPLRALARGALGFCHGHITGVRAVTQVVTLGRLPLRGFANTGARNRVRKLGGSKSRRSDVSDEARHFRDRAALSVGQIRPTGFLRSCTTMRNGSTKSVSLETRPRHRRRPCTRRR